MISKNVTDAVANLQAETPASTGKALPERLKEITCLYESRRRGRHTLERYLPADF